VTECPFRTKTEKVLITGITGFVGPCLAKTLKFSLKKNAQFNDRKEMKRG
jgi:GDP-D-mannose dehydratase